MTFTAILSQAKLLPTKLLITVQDEQGNSISGVQVKVYKSKEDYRNSSNELLSGTTGKKSKIKFKGAEAKIYFIDARKGKMKSDGKAVESESLSKGKGNKVTVTIR